MQYQTTPGIRNRRKISETMERIIGAAPVVSAPSAARHADPSGYAVPNSSASPSTIAINDQRNPLRSFG